MFIQNWNLLHLQKMKTIDVTQGLNSMRQMYEKFDFFDIFL